MTGPMPIERVAAEYGDSALKSSLHREACVNFMTVLAAAQRAFDAKQFDVAAGKLRAARAIVERVSGASR